MKIVFYLGPAFERWTPDSAERGGAGGAELFAARASKELAKRGHGVTVYADTDGPGWYDGVRWLQYGAWPPPAESAGILISWRRPEILDQDLSRFGRVYFMAQDNHYGSDLTDARVAKVDRWMVVSPWHRTLFSRMHPNVPAEKIMITRNGIDLSYYGKAGPERELDRVIWTSSPDRGLRPLLEAWNQVRLAHPTAKLDIYYGFKTLAARAEQRGDQELKDLIAGIWGDMGYLKELGVLFHDRVGQAAMASAYRRAAVWVGPHAWDESYCQAAAEAQVAGCKIVAPPRAALATTIKGPRIWTGDLAKDVSTALSEEWRPYTWADGVDAKAEFGIGPVIDHWELELGVRTTSGVAKLKAEFESLGGRFVETKSRPLSTSADRPTPGANKPGLSAGRMPALDQRDKGPDLVKVGPTPAGKLVTSGSSRPTIGLCMIVKNEAQRILRCLHSIWPFIDHWTIVDTGSTDATKGLAEVTMQGLPGAVHDRPWVNWHTNMGEAFALAKGHTDFVWIIDADEEVTGQGRLGLDPSKDAYMLAHDYAGGVSFERMRILSTTLNWVQKGIGPMQIHEYPTVPDLGRPLTKATVAGIRVVNHNDGNQGSLTPEARRARYKREAENCEEALAEDPNDYRAAYYRGQSWRDAGDYAQAINAFEWRAGMVGGWDEETFVAALEAAKLRGRRGDNPDTVKAAFMRAFALRPWRAEPLCYLAGYMRERRNYKEALAYAMVAAAIPYPKGDILFVDSTVYTWRISDELCVAYYWTGEYKACAGTAQYLIDTGPAEHQARFKANLDHATKAMNG